MTDLWSSLYLRADDSAAVAQALERAAAVNGYTLFNPFSGAPGRTWPRTLRLFVAPAQGGWVRVLGQPDEALLPELSHHAPLLWAELEGDRGRLDAWDKGRAGRVEAIFGAAPEDADALPPSAPTAAGSSVFDALPDEVKAMNTRPDQAQAMLDKLSGGLIRKAGGDEASAKAALQGHPPQWDSREGRRVAALLDRLDIPGWAQPDFVTVRDAYQLHLRRQLRPNAPLYHGDQDTLDAVPNALDYRPVYAGKK
jgi:hypothetical protein